MTNGYIYLIMMADGVYKVGRTEQEYGTTLKRFKSYPADSVITYVRKVQSDPVILENQIIEILRNEFGKHPRGNEYFVGDENRMIEIINGIVNVKPGTVFEKHPLKRFIESGNIVLDPTTFCPLKLFIVRYKAWCRDIDIKVSRFNENFYKDIFAKYKINVKMDSLIYKGFAYWNQEFVFGLDFMEPSPLDWNGRETSVNPLDKAHKLIPKMKDWPPIEERKIVDVYEMCGIPRPVKFVKEGTDPDGPNGLHVPQQEVAGRPDACVDPDDD